MRVFTVPRGPAKVTSNQPALGRFVHLLERNPSFRTRVHPSGVDTPVSKPPLGKGFGIISLVTVGVGSGVGTGTNVGVTVGTGADVGVGVGVTVGIGVGVG